MSSSLDDLDGPWGQLLGIVKEGDGDLVPLVGEEFSIGRGKDADLVIQNNRFVSTTHCTLVRDENGWVTIRDTSSNGTLLNGNRLQMDTDVKLSSDDVIKIVSRKDKPEFNITFKFSYLIEPTQELESTLSYTDESQNEQTLDYSHTEEDGEAVQTVGYDPSDMVESEGGVGDGPQESCDFDGVHEGGETEDVKVTSSEQIPGKKRQKSCEGEGPKTKKVAVESSSEGKPIIQPQTEEKDDRPSLKKEDSMAETLTCQICQEILHDCISLQPCMHSYCAGCYSEWMDTSDTCPACRNKVERISKNHIVNNLVDAYLRANPDKKRPEEDLKELDDKNKITKDMLYPKKKHHHHDYYSGDEGDDYSSTDSSSDDDSVILHTAPFIPTFPHVMHSTAWPVPSTLCRQCPGYAGHASTPSHITPPPFTCSTSTNHVLCLCCLQPMPDRRNDSDMSIPPQKCDICGQAYCHMYWSCTKPGCRGCLNLFKDIDFPASILNGILNNGNVHESRILNDYLEVKSLSIKDVLAFCCIKLESGEYTCSDSRTHRMDPSTRTCYKCALKNFKDLVYLYRKDIPDDELPVAVTGRPDCYWGKNCRTQVNKPHHAQNYNHICDQTRH